MELAAHYRVHSPEAYTVKIHPDKVPSNQSQYYPPMVNEIQTNAFNNYILSY
jgi:hypothetical protein